MKTLKEKLEDIMQLTENVTTYMEQMWILLTDLEFRTKFSSTNQYENTIEILGVESKAVEHGFFRDSLYYTKVYTLEHCIGELVLSKGKNILQQIDWLD